MGGRVVTSINARAQVTTTNASRYLMQLCKHFRHKVSVEFDAHNGRVDFPFGLCLMEVSGDVLTLDCQSGSAEDMDRMRHVLDDHLERFAWKEKLQLSWTVPAET